MPTASAGLPRTVAIIRDGAASSRTRSFSAGGSAASPYSDVSGVHSPRKNRTGRDDVGVCKRASTPCTDVGSDSSSFWAMRAFWYAWRKIAESRWRISVDRESERSQRERQRDARPEPEAPRPEPGQEGVHVTPASGTRGRGRSRRDADWQD